MHKIKTDGRGMMLHVNVTVLARVKIVLVTLSVSDTNTNIETHRTNYMVIHLWSGNFTVLTTDK